MLALTVTGVAVLVAILVGAAHASASSHNTRSLNTVYDEPVSTHDTSHFRVHYTTTGEHAADPDSAPIIADAFEDAWAEQVDAMGWPAPVNDGGLGGDGRTDIYLRDRDTLPATAHVMIDKFPDGAGGYEPDCDPHRCADVSTYLRVATDLAELAEEFVASTAHHEFNHLVQNTMAHRVERWMGEGTAKWMEGEVSVDGLPPFRPIDHFAQHPDVPLAQDDPHRRERDYQLLYAAWVWPRWVADRHGPDAVRDAWVEALDADQEGLGGYDAVLAQRGTSFADEFLEFAAATAAWRHDFPWYGFSDSFLQNQWPDEWDVRREDDLLEFGEQATVTLDHTAYALYELAASEGVELRASASGDVAGGVAIVADRGLGDVTRVTAPFEGGEATVTLTEGTDGAALTAAVVNADPTVDRPYDPDDPGPVEYAADDITFTLEVDDAGENSTDDEDTTGGEDSAGGEEQADGEDVAACPEGEVPDAGFADIAGNVHGAGIDCVAWYQITQGATATTYGPGSSVRRDQMASFIARTMTTAGFTLPDPSDQGFADVAGNTHEEAINQLAAAGVVQGTTPGTYSPGLPVNRAQMASFLVRAYETMEDPLPTGGSGFADTGGNTHEGNIAKAAEAGFAKGTTASTYSPGDPVRRDQMGSFLARKLERLAADGRITPPEVNPVIDGACTAADSPLAGAPIADNAEHVVEAVGDLDGDDEPDHVTTYRRQADGESVLRVATAAGYVDEAVLEQAHQAEHVTPLGAANIGGGRQIAFVVENVGVAGENVGLWGLHDRDDASCELARVTAPDHDSPLLPVRATTGSTAALACRDFDDDSTVDLVEYKALRDADSDTYEWTEQAWTWSGAGQLTSVGQDSGTTQSPQAGLDCPNIDRS